MRKNGVIYLFYVFVFGIVLSACTRDTVRIPDKFDIDLATESGLDAPTLAVMREVNQTIEGGLEVGDKTRELIREINDTVSKGIKLDDNTLNKLTEMVSSVAVDIDVNTELTVGIDKSTQQILQNAIDTYSPTEIESTLTTVIAQLGEVGTDSAEEISEYLQQSLDNVTNNIKDVERTFGKELRCNADYFNSSVEDAYSRFIGDSVFETLQNILVNDEVSDSIVQPKATVCHIEPDIIKLVQYGDKVYMGDQTNEDNEDVIRLIGFNFSSGYLPEAFVMHENGETDTLSIPNPSPQGNYQLAINLARLDFKEIPVRSSLVIQWSEDDFHAIPISPPALPTVTPTPTATPTPTLQCPTARISPTSGLTANVYVGPGVTYSMITTLSEGQTFCITGQALDIASSINPKTEGILVWWEISLDGQRVWISSQTASLLNEDRTNEIPFRIPVATPTPTSTPLIPTPTLTPTPVTPTRPPTRVPPTPTPKPIRWIYDRAERYGSVPDSGLEVSSSLIPDNYVITGVGAGVRNNNFVILRLQIAPIQNNGTLGPREIRNFGSDPHGGVEGFTEAGPQQVVVGVGFEVYDDNIRAITIYTRYLDPRTGELGSLREVRGGRAPDVPLEVQHFEFSESTIVVGVGARVNNDSNVTTLELRYGSIGRH